MIKTIKRDSQNADLLVHLAQGKKLTRLAALTIFGVQNITARISELRDLVHRIVYPRCVEYGTCPYTDEIVGVTKTDANGQEYQSYSIPNRSHRVEVGRYLAGLRRRAA